MLLALSAFICGTALAHRQSFLSYNFPKDADLGSAKWTVEGNQDGFTPDGIPNYVVVYWDGMLTHNGKPCMRYTYTFDDNTTWFSPEFVKLTFITGTDDASKPAHVTPCVEVIGDEGKAVYHFPQAEQNLELDQSMESTSVDGDVTKLGKLQRLEIYFDNVEPDENVSMEKINVYSHWFMPQVGPQHSSEFYTYTPGVKGNWYWAEPEKGVTYIQAEDYDDNSVQGKVAHCLSVAGGSNSYRSFDSEDSNLNVNGPDGGMIPFDGWHQRGAVFGYAAPLSYGIKNCTPTGKWMQYAGKYDDPMSNKISLEQAYDGFGCWWEYSFDVLEDCTIDVSLKVGEHLIPYMATTLLGTDAPENDRYLGDLSEGGYDVVGLNGNYLKIYGLGYRVAVDGVYQKSAWAKRPVYQEVPEGEDDAPVNIDCIKNPSKWVDAPDDITVFAFPYPLTSINHDLTEIGPLGKWDCFYKADLFRQLVTDGEKTEAEVKDYIHPDFVGIPVKKGRHVLKVRTLGGITFFDEIKIRAYNGAGIEQVGTDSDADAIDFTQPVEYYDMQGRQIANPANGLYIVRQGAKVAKHYVR